jgi:twitching motility protein PilT
MRDLIEVGYEQRASDVFVKANSKPMMKQFSLVKPFPGEWPVLSAQDVERMCRELMTERQQRVFDDTYEMDLAYSVG